MSYSASGGAAFASGLGIFLLVAFLIGLYFIPAAVAIIRHVPNAGSVAVINFLFGWSLFGWGVALAMACRSRYQAVVTPYAPPPPDRYGYYDHGAS